jgi:hypothetical protein
MATDGFVTMRVTKETREALFVLRNKREKEIRQRLSLGAVIEYLLKEHAARKKRQEEI